MRKLLKKLWPFVLRSTYEEREAECEHIEKAAADCLMRMTAGYSMLIEIHNDAARLIAGGTDNSSRAIAIAELELSVRAFQQFIKSDANTKVINGEENANRGKPAPSGADLKLCRCPMCRVGG